ncbi:hypothetical protein HHK36_022779 [Tetracentron sinense]|uniref:Uncharacterized protein n=1 Tax=Tetracentron sinense TaxID=13715 RepID=A0A834YVF4_TETSI|nr:hypothetical protein HHK36_022779 [Tetracentron sinense]
MTMETASAEMLRQAGVGGKTSSPKDRALNRQRERLRNLTGAHGLKMLALQTAILIAVTIYPSSWNDIFIANQAPKIPIS